MLSKEKLKTHFHEGLLPAPEEKEEDFHFRVNFIKSSAGLNFFKLKNKNFRVFPIKSTLLEVNISWIFASKTSKIKGIFEPASVLIYKLKHKTYPILQLSPFYKNNLSEIMNHEVVHLLRCSFEEKKYEEHLAYRSSKYFYRRLLGPFCSSKSFFCSAALFPFFHLLSFDVFWVCLFFSSFFVSLLRILRLNKCYKNIRRLCENDMEAEKIIVCLKDLEIELFSKLSSDSTSVYIKNQQCLRWRTIKSIANLYIKK